ncbi:MAG: DUF4097 family beta strand repeat-containing protein [Clostridiales bacterium]|jgi:DUF4097 and DUF4098 domain-containing protein YvlB|nr:DUF4097 family beta strand repeat-containing protein [Clostridiales bacterium]
MKRSVIQKTTSVGAVLLVLAFSAAVAAEKERYEEPFEKILALAKDGKVQISNISGDIEVRSWSESQVKVKAVKVSRASSVSQAKENAAKVTIEITTEGNVLRIETRYPKSGRFWGGESVNVSVNYWLWIPEKAGLKVKNISGDIDVEGTAGVLDLSAISGDVNLRKSSGRAECNTISGDLEISGIAGDVFLKSVSGDITAYRIKGSIEAETVSGDVELKEVSEASTVRVKALSGEIVYSGDINPAGTYSLKSHSGSVELYLPANSAFDFAAETFSGNITTDFEIKVTGKISPKEMSGVVGGGGATVKLSSFSGDIKLKKS